MAAATTKTRSKEIELVPQPRVGGERIFAYEPRLPDILVGQLGEFRRAASRLVHRVTYRPTRRRTAKMLVIVPAHNEEHSIGRTLAALLTQTRAPDRIVVVADNCTDNTERVARRYRGVTVMRTVDNKHRKVGALTQGWQEYANGYDLVAGVDADTVVAPDALAILEAEMEDNPNAGGVMARYTFEEKLATTFWARSLVRLQRIEFASWTMDMLRRNRRTYVLGGQATLFRATALEEVARTQRRHGPWDPSAQVEDMELTWRLNAARWDTLISSTARAYAGPMLTTKALWAQRRKWDEGMIRLLLSQGINGATWYPWRQQFKMLLDLMTRMLFIGLLVSSISLGRYHWSWIWAFPPVVAMLLNFKVVRRVPHRRPIDVFYAVTLVPVELYLWFRLAVSTVSWLTVIAGIRRDGWARQYRAEIAR